MAREKGAEPSETPRHSGRQGKVSAFGDAPADTSDPDTFDPDAFDPDRAGPDPGGEAGDTAGTIPDFIRRAMAFGFSGFFATEEAMRRALGDTVPKDWIDFAAEQSDRTRDDLTDRFGQEFGKILAQVDLAQLLSQLLEGRSVEVSAKIRLGGRDDSETQPSTAPRESGRGIHTSFTLSTPDEPEPTGGSSGPQVRRKPKRP
ncbi:MAG: hypothetical protein JRG96_08000 [Deltaproteobacteria bacterium]|nr:hypothetical protein [Deltaproteobacteria bacterium]